MPESLSETRSEETETPQRRGRGRPRKNTELRDEADPAPTPANPISIAASQPAVPEYPLAPTQNGLRPGDAGYDYNMAARELSQEQKVLQDKVEVLQDTSREISAMGVNLQVKKTLGEMTQEYLANKRVAEQAKADQAERTKKILENLGIDPKSI